MKPYQKLLKETDRLMEINSDLFNSERFEKALEIGEIANSILTAFREEQERNNEVLKKVIKRLDN